MMTSLKRFVQSRVDDGYYTPDTQALFNRPWHPLFVYGTLREGFCRHEFLEECPKVGTGFTRSKDYRMYNLETKSKLSNYPVILPTIDADAAGRIYGEIYLVPPKTLRTLDYIESNGIQYKRYSRVIDINNKTNPTIMTCWVYFGEPAAWKTARDNGSLKPLPRITDPTKPFPYYVYKKTDQQCTAA